MNKNIQQALDNVEMTYKQINEIANEMLVPILKPINELVNEVRNKAIGLPVDAIRDYMLQLQLKSFELSETKEKSALKSECAEALRKEKYAISFNEAVGAIGVKENTALLNVSEETVVECLYELVANLLKTKLDEIHRLVDVLKSILVSRMQETKFMNIGTSADVNVLNKANDDPYASTRQELNMGRGF